MNLTARCDTCGQEVELDRLGRALEHTMRWTPFQGVSDVPHLSAEIPCEGSGLTPIHVPGGEVAYLSNHFESKRSKH